MNCEKEEKLFTSYRWHDSPVYEVIGHREITDEEKEEVIKFKERQKDDVSNNSMKP